VLWGLFLKQCVCQKGSRWGGGGGGVATPVWNQEVQFLVEDPEYQVDKGAVCVAELYVGECGWGKECEL
jgi:hypothetical protein